MNIDKVIIKQDFRLHDVVRQTTKSIVRGRETYGTEQIQVLLALYDKGQSKKLKLGTSTKTLSIIEGFCSPTSIKIDDVITSFSESNFKVLELRKINESLSFLKAIFHDVQQHN